jgi:probable rRNA maturation factor
MHVNFFSNTGRRIPRKRIKALIALLEEEEDPPDSNVNLIFINDRHIAALNKTYRGRSHATDVLSFNIDYDSGENSILGEVYISTDSAFRNARERGLTYTDEILRLCCHGVLHLLGYDHIKTVERKIMQQKENHFLQRLKEWS